jgi:ABC-type glycerol-3-phosphate transport system substrate-binding protein
MKRALALSALAIAAGLAGAGPAAADSAWERTHARLIEQATVKTPGGLTIQYVYPGDRGNGSIASVFTPPTVFIPRENRSVAEEPAKK